MKNAVIHPPSNTAHARHQHRLPYRTMSELGVTARYTYVDPGTLFRCDCGKWFRAINLGTNMSEWCRVRWYHFKDQEKINRFEEREAHNEDSRDLA